MDYSTSFFFALVKRVREKKLISHLKLSDGRDYFLELQNWMKMRRCHWKILQVKVAFLKFW